MAAAFQENLEGSGIIIFADLTAWGGVPAFFQGFLRLVYICTWVVSASQVVRRPPIAGPPTGRMPHTLINPCQRGRVKDDGARLCELG